MTEREALQHARREYWAGVLKATNGNVTEAARRGGVHRSWVYRVIGELALKPRAHWQTKRGNWHLGEGV